MKIESMIETASIDGGFQVYADGGESAALFAGYRKVLSIGRIRTGKFDEALEKAILQCRNVIVILSPGSLDRCSDPGDYVRKEIELAIKEGKNIIPVMMEGFKLPEFMPEGLEEFPLHNGVFCSPQIFRDYTMKNIIDYLK